MVSQPGLVALPIGHHSLVEVGEGVAVVVYRNQALEPLELFLEPVSIEFDHSLSSNGLRRPLHATGAAFFISPTFMGAFSVAPDTIYEPVRANGDGSSASRRAGGSGPLVLRCGRRRSRARGRAAGRARPVAKLGPFEIADKSTA